MAGFETWNSTPEMQVDTITSIRQQITDSINDSQLTTDEADDLSYNLNSAINRVQTETYHELKDSMREVLVNWINIDKFSSAERRIWDYLWIDLPWYVAILEQDWYTIPDNYSIRDSGTYLVFHDENGKDIATINWETHETGWGWILIKNDDRTDNLEGGDLADSYDINREWIEEDKNEEIQRIRANLFDANIVFEDPFDYATLSLAAESFWLSEAEFRELMTDFQRHVTSDGHFPADGNKWKNIWMFERGTNQFWLTQNTHDWQYIWIYDRNGNFQRWGIWS